MLLRKIWRSHFRLMDVMSRTYRGDIIIHGNNGNNGKLRNLLFSLINDLKQIKQTPQNTWNSYGCMTWTNDTIHTSIHVYTNYRLRGPGANLRHNASL